MKNIKFLTVIIVFLGFAVLVQSCKKDDDEYTYGWDSQGFVNEAASINNFEIAAGNLAMIRGASDLVKQYGARMVEEHTAVGTELATLATSKSWTVPGTMQLREQEHWDRIANLTGAEFDMHFADVMVISHRDAKYTFMFASSRKGVPDAELRNFAESKISSLELHLEDAKTLQVQVD